MNTDQEFKNQKFDEELRSLIRETKGEELSAQFTNEVMHQIRKEKLDIEYKPVISVKALLMIALFFVFLITISLFQAEGTTGELSKWPAFSTHLFAGLLANWKSFLNAFSMETMLESNLFLVISGLFLALGLHYIFMTLLNNESKTKVKRLYSF